MHTQCPVCTSNETALYKVVHEYSYYECGACELIYISPDVLDKMDNGQFLISYDQEYWGTELKAARERSWGTTMARVAEVFLYARRPIRNFIDIGSGPGYFLDAINYQLPSASNIFHAAELFPPAEEFCTTNNNYHRGSLLDLSFAFDAGCCIEVIEHLTPSMLKRLFSDISKKSVQDSIYIFNTGLVEFIKNEDSTYLDPLVRGHVVGWSITALQHLAEPFGFRITAIPGKTWAFVAEYHPNVDVSVPLNDRIWTALSENTQLLKDKVTGELMYILGLETARAYI